MNQSPYTQTEPDPQGAMTYPPATRPKPGAVRRVLPIAAAVVLAVVAFGGGFAVANATATKTTGDGFTRNGQGPNGSGRPGFGGGTSGTVGSVAAGQLTISTASGGSKIVLLTPTTTVTKVSSTPDTVTDIASGNQVTVIGTTNPDGSVTANSIILGSIAGFGRGGGGGNDRSPAPSATP